MSHRHLLWLAALAGLIACEQEPPKSDWLENAPELSQNASASGSGDSDLSDVGASHTGHGGHR